MFIKNKKGQGLSLNVVIIAALALLVLVILSIVLVGRVGQTRQASETCENNGGQCVLIDSGECEGATARVTDDYTCRENAEGEETHECCISV